MTKEKDSYQELRENQTAMVEFFASKGWEILHRWVTVQTQGHFERAIRAETPEERETARIEGLTMEKFVRLAIYLGMQAGLNSADEALLQSEEATSKAK